MGDVGVAERWYREYMAIVQQHEAAAVLRDAAIAGDLARWTQALTGVVVSTCEDIGWNAAAKGHRSSLLPVAREEYLSLDVVAFASTGDQRWRFPVAVFELENSDQDDRVAYSLWKVLCVRASLRVVFCYRRDASSRAALVRPLADEIVGATGIAERAQVGGETMLVIGSRDEAGTFPYGFFKEWSLDMNTARFVRR